MKAPDSVQSAGFLLYKSVSIGLAVFLIYDLEDGSFVLKKPTELRIACKGGARKRSWPHLNLSESVSICQNASNYKYTTLHDFITYTGTFVLCKREQTDRLVKQLPICLRKFMEQNPLFSFVWSLKPTSF